MMDLRKSRPIREITSPRCHHHFQTIPQVVFLDYYGQYLIAKRQNEAKAIWSNAVACRKELQKMGDPGKEAQFCEMIFEGFVSREKAAKIYLQLYEESNRHPKQQEN